MRKKEIQYFKTQSWDDDGREKISISLADNLTSEDISKIYLYLKYFKKARDYNP
jgi:hypothetical protein